MARKQPEVIIEVEDLTYAQAKDVVMQGSSACIEHRIAAAQILSELGEGLTKLSEQLTKSVEETSLDDIQSDLVERGLCHVTGTDFTPVIKIGDRVKIKLSSKDKKTFNVLKEIKDVESLIPDKYLKKTVAIDKAAFEKAYEDGTLEDIFKSYVSSTTSVITKMTAKEIDK